MYKINNRVFIKPIHTKGVIKEISEDFLTFKVTYFDKDENGENKRCVNWFTEDQLDIWKGKRNKRDEIYFAKVKPDAIIPTKRDEDGCYDIFPCFEEDAIIIDKGQIKLIPTGIASCFPSKYRMELRERGSSGTKGLARRSGQIDSGYRDEWFIPINNTSDKIIIIAKEEVAESLKENCVTIYPYEKAIAQVALETVPEVNVKEVSYEWLKSIPSKRGMGKLGSTGK